MLQDGPAGGADAMEGAASVAEALVSRRVVLAGDARLVERLRGPEFQPLGSRIRRRLVLEYASRDELLACLDHLQSCAVSGGGDQVLRTWESGYASAASDGSPVRRPRT